MSSESLKSLIVTDPDLVDPELDISGLRTQTDTDPRLLASIADFPGISYDPTRFDYLSDLNELFAYGLPLVDTDTTTTPPATGTPGTGDGGGGSGGGSSAGGGSGGGSGPRNTAEEQRLIDAGIGLQDQIGAPVFASGEIPVTQAEIDEFNRRSVTPVSPTTQPIDPTGMLPQTSIPFMIPGALGVDPRETDDVLSGAITAKDAADPEGLLSRLGITGFDAKEAAVKAAINAAVGGPVTLLIDLLKGIVPPQDPRQTALNEFYPDRTSAGTIASGLMKGYNPVSGGGLYTLTGGRMGEEPTYGLQQAYQDRIDTITESLGKYNKYDPTHPDYDAEKAQQLIDRRAQLEADKKAEELATRGARKLVSGDIGKEDTGDAMLAELEAAKTRAGIQPTDPFLDIPDRQYADPSIITPDYDTVGMVDEYDEFEREFPELYSGKELETKSAYQKNMDLIDDFENNISGITSQDKIDVEKRLDELVGEYVENEIRPDAGVVNIPIIELEAQAVKEKLREIQDKNIIERGGGDDIGFGGLDPDRGQQVDRGTSGAGDDRPVTGTTKPGELRTSTYDAELEDERDVGGGGNQGGDDRGSTKIVCTMMTESYGFGSFRNKIWMKFHKDLSPEYQKGYHRLFLPLVKIAKKNVIVKKVLEHIAVHSTIDMRQSMRGKTHLLGRLYRKILLPLCYWVGKNAKR